MHQVNWVKCPKYVHNTVNFNQKKNGFLIFIVLSLYRVALYILGISFEIKS